MRFVQAKKEYVCFVNTTRPITFAFRAVVIQLTRTSVSSLQFGVSSKTPYTSPTRVFFINEIARSG